VQPLVLNAAYNDQDKLLIPSQECLEGRSTHRRAKTRVAGHEWPFSRADRQDQRFKAAQEKSWVTANYHLQLLTQVMGNYLDNFIEWDCV